MKELFEKVSKVIYRSSPTEVFDYAKELLGSKTSKNIYYNTTLHLEPDSVSIRYHGNKFITYTKDNKVIFYNTFWYSHSSTAVRVQSLLPIDIFYLTSDTRRNIDGGTHIKYSSCTNLNITTKGYLVVNNTIMSAKQPVYDGMELEYIPQVGGYRHVDVMKWYNTNLKTCKRTLFKELAKEILLESIAKKDQIDFRFSLEDSLSNRKNLCLRVERNSNNRFQPSITHKCKDIVTRILKDELEGTDFPYIIQGSIGSRDISNIDSAKLLHKLVA